MAPASSHKLARIVGLYAPHRQRVALLVAAILAVAIVGVGAPVLTGYIFDDALFPSSGEPNLELLVALVGLLIGLVALTAALGVVQAYLGSAVGQLVMHDLRDGLYGHLQNLSLRFFTGTRTGEIQSRLANDVGGVGSVLSNGIVSIASNSAIIVASLVAMALLAWPLALLTLPILVAFAYASYRVGGVRRRYMKETQETLAELASITEETLSVSGALLGKIFDRHRAAVERYRSGSSRLVWLRVREQLVGRMLVGVAQFFFLIGPALVYLGAGLAMAGGSAGITPGLLVAVTALQVRLYAPVRDLLDASMQLRASMAMFDRIFQYLDLPQDIVDAPGARLLDKDDARGEVEFRGVWFRYEGAPGLQTGRGGSRAWALEDVTMAVAPGQLAALVGPSGAGKTTLSYLLARLYDVERGSVSIDGVDVRDLRLSSLTDLIGVVTQETYLFHATVRENLLYARPDAEEAELEAAARLAFIHDRIAALPDGYDTVVGERGFRLSGGEKQRLAIARVILKNPRILILDEATSALDTTSERLIHQALQPLIAQRTTVAIAHRLSTILAADVIFVLDRGRVVEHGPHSELVGRGGLYARLYEQQFESALRSEAFADA
jgi:ATP-binding cassette subfamily B protein